MQTGIPHLTKKGQEALKSPPPDLTALCRNILVQIDGKRSVEELCNMFRGLKGLEEAIQRLIAGRYIEIPPECRDLIKMVAQQKLGAKAATLQKKIDDLHAKYGDQCWDHLEEIDKVARLFYGEVVADELKTEIARILRESKR